MTTVVLIADEIGRRKQLLGQMASAGKAAHGERRGVPGMQSDGWWAGSPSVMSAAGVVLPANGSLVRPITDSNGQFWKIFQNRTKMVTYTR